MSLRTLREAFTSLAVMTILTGFAYPLVITGIAKSVFPSQAVGSLVMQNGKPIGSGLIGQNFSDPKYFWSRPSATSPQPYNAIASGGSNLGPLNPALMDRIKATVDSLHKADPGNRAPIPVDLVTASASGLDPDISPAAAYYQRGRVARARGIPVERVDALIASHIVAPTLGFIGESRTNVLRLNLALDELDQSPTSRSASR